MYLAISKRNLLHALPFDLIERVVLALFFGFLSFNLLRGYWQTGAFDNLLLLASEGSVFVFVVARRFANTMSLKPMDWLVAVGGTILPSLAQPTGVPPEIPGLTGVVAILMLTGLAIQLAAKFTLRRSFGVVAANRGIKVSGPYRTVRHPMYAGYILTHIGFLLHNPSFWNLMVYAIGAAFQIARILAEERVLLRDEAYQEFVAQTRYRLIFGVV